MGKPIPENLFVLAVRWQQGSSGTALARAVNHYVNDRMRVVFAKNRVIRKNRDDLADIRQEGALEAIRAIRNWRPGRSPIHHFIRPNVDRAIRKGIRATRSLRPTPPHTPHPPALTDAIALLQAANQLDPRTRKIIRWCLLDPAPATIRQASLALGVSEATAKRLYRKGAKLLASILTG